MNLIYITDPLKYRVSLSLTAAPAFPQKKDTFELHDTCAWLLITKSHFVLHPYYSVFATAFRTRRLHDFKRAVSTARYNK